MDRLTDILRSFLRLPRWVQVWVVLVLVPVNIMPLWFPDQPFGKWIAALSILGMLSNLPILWVSRGFSKAMGLPHVASWGPQILLVAWLLVLSGLDMAAGFRTAMVLLLCINTISVLFDAVDSIKWFNGAREVA